MFADYPPLSSDLLLCYDYRSMTFDASVLEGYCELRVVAWSMGVWVAGQVLGNLSGLPAITGRLAVNGTPFPIDDVRGIPVAIFRGTLEGLNPQTLGKFRRRMCGSSEGVKAFLAHGLTRPLEELREELASLYRLVSSLPSTGWAWEEAWIGRRDRIFPAANQQEAWKGIPVFLFDEEHYSPLMLAQAVDGKKDDKRTETPAYG